MQCTVHSEQCTVFTLQFKVALMQTHQCQWTLGHNWVKGFYSKSPSASPFTGLFFKRRVTCQVSFVDMRRKKKKKETERKKKTTTTKIKKKKQRISFFARERASRLDRWTNGPAQCPSKDSAYVRVSLLPLNRFFLSITLHPHWRGKRRKRKGEKKKNKRPKRRRRRKRTGEGRRDKINPMSDQ